MQTKLDFYRHDINVEWQFILLIALQFSRQPFTIPSYIENWKV